MISKYTLRRKRKNMENGVNTDKIGNKLKRKFNGKNALEVVVSDLTYVEIDHEWHYICLLIELSHREIIGYSVGKNRDADLVKAALYSVKCDLRSIGMFHTDRGGEFKNEEIDNLLETFKIERSLSNPGTPIDNAVCESMYGIVKTEFVYDEKFTSLEDLRSKLSAWVWWYNNERLHSSLQYKTPVESRKTTEIGVTDETVANKKYQKFWQKIALHQQKIAVEKAKQL